MDKITQLFIRACKSKNPTQRLLSVHRRFYGVYGTSEVSRKVIITGILSEIVDEYVPMSAYKIMQDMHHSYTPLEEITIQEKCFKIMMYRIRHSKKDCFEGLTTPVKFIQGE